MANKTMYLKRTYTHAGRMYGPGLTQVPEEIEIGGSKYTPFADIQKREDEYNQHLKAGGEPIAPVTPSLAGNVDAKPENATALNTPSAPVTPLATAATPDLQEEVAKKTVAGK